MIYLATPYTKYHLGIEKAFEHAAELAARLLRRGIVVYSPIVHTHPIAKYGNIDPLNHEIWLDFDATMMEASKSLLVAQMEGWEDSYGVAHEIDVFLSAGKPIRFLNPETLEIDACPLMIAA